MPCARMSGKPGRRQRPITLADLVVSENDMYGYTNKNYAAIAWLPLPFSIR
jgi:hypothetical protein